MHSICTSPPKCKSETPRLSGSSVGGFKCTRTLASHRNSIYLISSIKPTPKQTLRRIHTPFNQHKHPHHAIFPDKRYSGCWRKKSLENSVPRKQARATLGKTSPRYNPRASGLCTRSRGRARVRIPRRTCGARAPGLELSSAALLSAL